MKIIKEYAGSLTNFEVLDFLRSRGAGKDPTQIIASVTPSEYKVYDYLDQTAASVQTKDAVNKVMEEFKKYDLTAAEKLNIINLRPASEAEIDSMIEDCEDRFGESRELLVETVIEVLPPLPTLMEDDEENNEATAEEENNEETTNEDW